MSDGRTHLMVNTLCSAAIVLSATFINKLSPGGIESLAAGCILGTVFITPDLDMPVRTVTLQFWGPLGFLWWPVLKLSRHRGRSHTYFQGPAFRLLYTAVLCSPLLYWLYHKGFRPEREQIIYFVLSYLLMQWIHLWMDGIKPSQGRL